MDKLEYFITKKVKSIQEKVITEVSKWPRWISSKFTSNDFRKFKHIGSINTVSEILSINQSELDLRIKYGVSFLSKLARYHIRYEQGSPEYITITPKKSSVLTIPFDTKWVGKKYPFPLRYLPKNKVAKGKTGFKHNMKVALGLASNRKAPILARTTRTTISPVYVLLKQVKHRREIDFPEMDSRIMSLKVPKLERILRSEH